MNGDVNKAAQRTFVNLKGYWQIFSMEIRQALSYRVDFWIDFFMTIIIQMTLAFYLWNAVFGTKKVETLGGYHFNEMMFYYLMVPMIYKIVGQFRNEGIVAGDIYDGGLSRYILMPTSFFLYKFCRHLATSFIASVQFLLGLSLYILVFGKPAQIELTPQSVICGFVVLIGSAYLYFVQVIILEMIAFWSDNVWSLVVMFRLSISLLGGGLIPLTLFPEWLVSALSFSPFPYLIDFPIRVLWNKESAYGVGLGCIKIVIWSVVLSFLAKFIWNKGKYHYTGVGI